MGGQDGRARASAEDLRIPRQEVQGVGVEDCGNNHWRISGVGGAFPVRQAELFLGNAGTAFRPLTAALALSGGDYVLKGVARMHERPIGDLVDALKQLGARIDYLGSPGFPPLHIHPAALAGDRAQVRGNVSSQFLTGLLMALPLRQGTTTVEVVGELISKPYIGITLAMLRRFGVEVAQDGWQAFTVTADARYRSPGAIYVEGDASSASYFLAAGAIGGGPGQVQIIGGASGFSSNGSTPSTFTISGMTWGPGAFNPGELVFQKRPRNPWLNRYALTVNSIFPAATSRMSASSSAFCANSG